MNASIALLLDGIGSQDAMVFDHRGSRDGGPFDIRCSKELLVEDEPSLDPDVLYVASSAVLEGMADRLCNMSVAVAGGLQEGDRIIRIDGKKVFTEYDISFLMQRNESGKYHFVVMRGGKKTDLPEVSFARRTGGNFSYNADLSIHGLSAGMKRAGLEEGDRILSVNGRAVENTEALAAAIAEDDDYVIDYVVERNRGSVDVKGVKMATMTVLDFIIQGEEKNFFNVTSGALKYTVTLSRLVYISLFDLLRGHYGIRDLAGPIGTVSVITEVAQDSAASADWSTLFMIMALITINIGLFNLLPIPALDGGRFFFMLIELIFRRPIPPKYENRIHAIGMVLLLAFMLLISAGDIWKLITGVGFY